MARILIGWELGAGNGHSIKLRDAVLTLRARGHDPVIAVQNLAAFPIAVEAWQAPLWPTQLRSVRRPVTLAPSTMGDILAALGMADVGAVSALIGGWDRILAAVRPDVVAAEYAPGLIMAARGRVPTVMFGTGFTVPPAGLPAFPSLTGRPAARDEAALLQGLNRELALAGRASLPSLPALFAADASVVQVFAELDPYRSWRAGEHISAPHMNGLPPLSDGKGDEIFIYMSGQEPWPAGFWDGVIETGLPVRVYDSKLDTSAAATLERQGIAVERGLVPIEKIVERSRLILCNGGLGLTAAGLCAGIPLALIAFDLEKRLIAASLSALGLGAATEYRALDREKTAAFLSAAYADAAIQHASLAAAADFCRRAIETPSEAVLADVIETLLTGSNAVA